MGILEGEELDEVQQSSAVEEPVQKPNENQSAATADAATTTSADEQSSDTAQKDAATHESHPLEPNGDRFKQVWARAKKAEERAAQVEAEAQAEREARIRLEERLAAKEASVEAKPQYTWAQLQAAVDAGQIDMGKALEIRDQQLYDRWQKDQEVRDRTTRVLADVSTEMTAYKQLVPNASVPGTEERKKVEREFGYLVQRLGKPATREQELSMELAAARAAFGDLDTLRQKKTLASKPLEREGYMETSSTQSRKPETKKDFKTTLTPREVQHYERLMRNGRYPGGWSDVEKEHQEYDAYKAAR